MKKKKISVLVGLLLLVVGNTQAQVSGTVFRDFNFNGIRTTASPAEPLVAGIIVNAYNSANQLIASYTTTNGSGTAATYPYTGPNYSIPASGTAYNGTPGSNTGFVPSGTAVRLEFITSANGCLANSSDPSSKNGTANGTSVQFLTAPSTTASYAVSNPADYNTGTSGVSVFIPRFSAGDPLAGGTIGSRNWFLGFPYSNAGFTAPAQTVNGSTIGTVWGVAYSKQAKKIFTSAFVKRHAGLGVLGSGGIYLLTPTATSFTISNFFDMDNNTFNTASNPITRTRFNGASPAYGNGASFTLSVSNTVVNFNGSTDSVSSLPSGLGVIGTNVERGLPANIDIASYDGAAYDQVGKVGLGDIDISDDGKFLFVTNLYQRKIFRLELNDAYNPTSVIAVTVYALPAQAVTNGLLRPFGLKYSKGKLYVGAVATGENETTATTANLFAYVYELQNAIGAAAFNTSAILTLPLSYNKGKTIDELAPTGTRQQWKPWVNTAFLSGTNSNSYSQPILSDIEFTDRGDMLLDFTDRYGHQTGQQNHPYLGSIVSTARINGMCGGDIVIAGKSCSTGGFAFESNGSFTSNGTAFTNATGVGNTQGIGGGEFFNRELFTDNIPAASSVHNETSMGSFAVLSGADNVLLTVIDPLDFTSGGVVKFSTSTGSKSDSYQLSIGNNGGGSPPTTFGKAASLGDIELLTPLQPIEVGNRIWNDANANGVQDAGETAPGVPAGTTVTLRSPGPDGIYGNGDDQTWTTTTDANGNYYFNTLSSSDNRRTAGMVSSGNFVNELVPGLDYRIEVATPSGLQVSKTDAAANSVDNIDNDAVANGTLATVTFNTSNTNHNFDIGFNNLASIGDKVYRDDDKDGIQDAGEPGVAGVTVTLYQNGTDGLPGTADDVVVGTTVTDAYGNYLFDNLPPSTTAATSYNVGFTLPTNYQFTTQTNTQITGTSDATNTTTTTSGSTAANGSDANVSTGRTGSFWLAPGEAERGVDAGIIFNTPTPPNSIGNRVWFDTDGGGDQDANEPGVSGVTVTLYAADGVTIVATTVTDANGNYLFTGLPANTNYIVGVTPPAGTLFTSTSGTTTGTDTDSDVSTTSGLNYGKTAVINTGSPGTSTLTIDAGLITQPATKCSLGDRVWYDNDRDGEQDAGEPGIAGVTIQLLDAGGNVIATTVTDALGNYIFPNLDPGDYRVIFGPVPGMQRTTQNVTTGAIPDATDSDADPITGLSTGYRLVAGERNMSVDCGYYSTQPAANVGALGDKVWNDLNGDGIQDANEPGVAGVTITLYNSAGTAIATTVTDANGNYLFPNLTPGDYSVGFSNIPAGYGFTGLDRGGNDANDSDANPATGRTALATVTGGNTTTTLDAGIRQGNNSGLGSLGDKVWYDLDNDGIQDAGELGVAGVTVTLLDAGADGIVGNGDDGPSKTTTTNALGEYIFDGLPAGNYAVQFSNLPVGFTLSPSNAGANDGVDSDGGALGTGGAPAGASRTAVYSLAQGEDNLTVDLGIVPPANTNTLGGTAWFDTDSDGLQAGNPARVPGVLVTLYNNAGVAIATTTTDENGDYLFVGLADGNYSVGFSNYPTGYDVTTREVTNTASGGSDADRVSGRTSTVTLGIANRNDRSLDAGLVSPRAALGNYVWDDLDRDGIQDAGETPVAGVTVSLYFDANNDGLINGAEATTPVATAITDADGKYFFPNLTPGNYQVGFTTIPTGMEFTTQDNTTGPDGDGVNSNGIGGDSDVNPSTGRTGIINLSPNEVDLTVDAGIRVNLPATIGNKVWADLDADGIQDANEPGIAGVVVTLYNSSNQPIGSAVTDGNGNWQITNVPTGTGYYVIFTSNLPNFDVSGAPGSNPAWTAQNIGANGTQALDSGTESDTDSDVTPSGANAGRTGTFSIVPGNNFPNIDAGIINWPANNILPIQLVSFTAQPQNTTVQLSWVVATETNVNTYEVEYSINGVSYSSIGSKAATGNRNYNLLHTNPKQGLNYYRLKIIDKDGKVSYSEVRKVNFGIVGVDVKIYPNPATSYINVTVTNGMINQSATIMLIAVDGKVVYQQNTNALSQTENINLNKLANGKYIVRIITNNEVVNKQIQVIK